LFDEHAMQCTSRNKKKAKIPRFVACLVCMGTPLRCLTECLGTDLMVSWPQGQARILVVLKGFCHFGLAPIWCVHMCWLRIRQNIAGIGVLFKDAQKSKRQLSFLSDIPAEAKVSLLSFVQNASSCVFKCRYVSLRDCN
jgi:hypothetical protein